MLTSVRVGVCVSDLADFGLHGTMLKTHHTWLSVVKCVVWLTGGWRVGERGRNNHKVFSMCVVCAHLCAAVHAYVCMHVEARCSCLLSSATLHFMHT